MRLRFILFSFGSALAIATAPAASFNRDIRPILTANCVECHGSAKAKAGLRLDSEAEATKSLKSEKVAIVPGHPEKSELINRVKTGSPDDRMPPEDAGKKPLGTNDIALLEQWISEGAEWDQHWAFAPLSRPKAPATVWPDLAQNPIDAFVQKGIAAAGLKPSERADERILRRRLAFDLAGLPPAQVEYKPWEAAVGEYLAANSFGERMAVWWLDLVRYADSEGYFSDSYRQIYPYRDYVIRSFNTNKPFDRFTHEQLAGDLLPGSGWDERIGSGYNRLILTTHEDGANAREYRARYAADRVRNLGAVWLGLTLGCAQCHDHKFDPTSAADFYRFAAFFADIKEQAIYRQKEIAIAAGSEKYSEIRDELEGIDRLFDADPGERRCFQLLATQEYLENGTTPPGWPRSPRTEEILQLIKKDATGKSAAFERTEITGYFRRHFFRKLGAEAARLSAAKTNLDSNAQWTLVTERGPVHTVRVLPRGNWLDESGPQVEPRFPKFLPTGTPSEERLTRLDLARWLTSPDNPLTARVLANRLWQLFFEEGLVRTPDDFGLQGEAPGHPELLDWLASELIDSGWDIKHVVKLIVTSHAYQQSSAACEKTLVKDPENRLFARQNRFSIAAEFVRDNALSIAGLLSNGHGGPPVRGYLPKDYLKLVDTLNEEPYQQDTGERLYRRGIYLLRTRTTLHPMLAAFNASTREECVSGRGHAQTPHQALALLNSPLFVEASQAFAERILCAGNDDQCRVNSGIKLALGRDASNQETAILLKLLEENRASFAKDRVGAAKLLRSVARPLPGTVAVEELAAWIQVARAILNLQEVNTRY